MASRTWRDGRNAIVITWDEDDFSDSGVAGTGCCGSNVGGDHVVTIVITNRGDESIVDGTAYNHYSLPHLRGGIRPADDRSRRRRDGASHDQAVPQLLEPRVQPAR
jgi:hypothetical protein